MDDTIHWPHGHHCPAPTNHLINDPTPRDQAVYVPSVTPGYARAVYEKKWKRPFPKGVDHNDLNFLDHKNKLFHISHVMSSAGRALKQTRPCIITTRDRTKTMLLCDSGGYQIANGSLTIKSDKDRLAILRWQERYADVAMTLDVPTGPLLRSTPYRFQNITDCLNATLDHLAFYVKNRETMRLPS